MGAKLCSLWHPKSEPKPKTPQNGARNCGSSFMECIELRCLKRENQRRLMKTQIEGAEKKTIEARKLTLEDWLLASPRFKPDSYLRRGKRKVHPSSSSSSQVPRSLIRETKDSLCLERPLMMNREEEGEGEGKSESFPLFCGRSSSTGKTQKRVSFKLPPDVIIYSPDEDYCSEDEASFCSPEEPNWSSEDSFSSKMVVNCRGGSFDSPEELCLRLAVNNLPRVSVSSSIEIQSCIHDSKGMAL